MAGSGTGTPAVGAGAATLATLRARVLQQLTAGSSRIDHLPVTTSALTLTTMRDRVETVLQDSGNLIWATGDIDEAILHAFEQFSRKKPAHALTTITLAANGREVDISSITGLLRVEHVWWDYDSSAPGHPPTYRHFQTWPGSIIYINDPSEPQSGDKVRVWYTTEHTLSGVGGASATTLPIDDESFLIHGAAAFAARFRAIEQAELANVDSAVYDRLMAWAKVAMSEFTEGLRIRDWRTYTFQYDQDDITEAIRYALHRYNEIVPDRTITTLTLTSTGREIDISTITNYHTIEQVWLNYDASAPEHPPRWADCELWPGDILYVDEGNEPQSGDVVRIWYTRLHTVTGLDSASATSLPTEHDTLIVIGASGFAAQERVQDEGRRYVPRKLREWAKVRLREFERGLKHLAREEGIKHSGITEGPALDRWDTGEWA